MHKQVERTSFNLMRYIFFVDGQKLKAFHFKTYFMLSSTIDSAFFMEFSQLLKSNSKTMKFIAPL